MIDSRNGDTMGVPIEYKTMKSKACNRCQINDNLIQASDFYK